MADRPTRPCIACGQHDDHPRHEVVLPDFSSILVHLDCHALASPPCESCKATVDGADGATGPDLIAHLDSIREN